MKNVIFATLVAAAISTSAVAQETSKSVGAENSLEIGFNPFSNNYSTFRINELKYRRFFGENALRVRLNFDINSSKNTVTNNSLSNPGQDLLNPNAGGITNSTDKETVTNTSSTKLSLYVGYERHFSISRNANIYAGAEIGYELQSGSKKVEENETGSYESLNYYNGTDSYDRTTRNSTSSSVEETKKYNSFGAFGANIFTGIDVNIWKGFYLGAELGLNLKSKSVKAPEVTKSSASTTTEVRQSYNRYANPSTDITTTVTTTTSATDADGNVTGTRIVTVDGVPTTNEVNTGKNYVQNKSTEFNLGLYVAPALRIGWRF